MSIIFNVITPLARFENINSLKEMLEHQNVVWHVITDDDSKETVEFTEDWIKHYVCPNKEFAFWERCNNSINWFIETQKINHDEFYCFMNDDDGYEPRFFDKMRSFVEKNSGEVIICSMERGHYIPDNAVPPRRHGTDTLIAHPHNMRIGQVGVEQIYLTGRILSENRLPLHVAGDGMMITEIVKKYPTIYFPELLVYFNYLEPGRWKK
jgi:hypothetical protein